MMDMGSVGEKSIKFYLVKTTGYVNTPFTQRGRPREKPHFWGEINSFESMLAMRCLRDI